MKVADECSQGRKNGTEKNKVGLKGKRGEMERNTIKGTNSERLERKKFPVQRTFEIKLANFKGTK